MRTLGISGLLFTLSLSAGCVVLPMPDNSQSGIAQEDFIASWHRCVEDNLARLKAEGQSPGKSVDNTLVACQGHRDDVLATFPDHLQQPLQKLMVQQTWETGYAAWSPVVSEVAQSATHLLR